MDCNQVTRVLEAILLCANEPMSLERMGLLFVHDEAVDRRFLRQALEALQEQWQGRGLELVEVAQGWRFQSTLAMQPYFERVESERPPRYSRAVLETLAIIAWHQPVTRGDIEEIRGVSVSSQIVKTLEQRGWIETIGYRDGPGRPQLLATTSQFLSDLGLRALDDLPALELDEKVLAAQDDTLADLLNESPINLEEGS